MAKGQATGESRDYQVFCRELIGKLCCCDVSLVPYSNDGIDIPFDFAGTTWRLDVALKAPDGGRIVVAECKNWGTNVSQGEVYLFAHKVEDLRRTLRVDVAGFFFVHSGYQVGALSVGDAAIGLRLVKCEAGQPEEIQKIEYLRADPERQRRISEQLIFAKERVPSPADEGFMEMKYADGTVKTWSLGGDRKK